MIYFLQAGGPAGLVKIGTSTNLERRCAELQRINALPCMLIGLLPGHRAEERELHARFRTYRKHGEWFEPSAEVLAEAEGFDPVAVPFVLADLTPGTIPDDIPRDDTWSYSTPCETYVKPVPVPVLEWPEVYASWMYSCGGDGLPPLEVQRRQTKSWDRYAGWLGRDGNALWCNKGPDALAGELAIFSDEEEQAKIWLSAFIHSNGFGGRSEVPEAWRGGPVVVMEAIARLVPSPWHWAMTDLFPVWTPRFPPPRDFRDVVTMAVSFAERVVWRCSVWVDPEWESDQRRWRSQKAA